jgi:hypothetical protein
VCRSLARLALAYLLWALASRPHAPLISSASQSAWASLPRGTVTEDELAQIQSLTNELKDLLGKYQTAVNERNFSVWSCFLDLRKILPKLAAGGSLASRRSLRGDQLFQKLKEVKETYLRAVQAGLGQGEPAGLVEHVLHVFDALPGLLDGVPLELPRLNDLPQSNDVVRCGGILRVLQGVPTLNWLREAVANYTVRFRGATPSGVSADDHSQHHCMP